MVTYQGRGVLEWTCVEVMGWRVGGCQMEGSLDLTVASSCEKLVFTSLASEVNPYCTNIPNRLQISSGEVRTYTMHSKPSQYISCTVD